MMEVVMLMWYGAAHFCDDRGRLHSPIVVGSTTLFLPCHVVLIRTPLSVLLQCCSNYVVLHSSLVHVPSIPTCCGAATSLVMHCCSILAPCNLAGPGVRYCYQVQVHALLIPPVGRVPFRSRTTAIHCPKVVSLRANLLMFMMWQQCCHLITSVVLHFDNNSVLRSCSSPSCWAP